MDEQRKDLDRFLTTGRAAKRLGVCGPTLRNWAEANAIDYVRTHTGRYRFDVDGYLAKMKSNARP